MELTAEQLRNRIESAIACTAALARYHRSEADRLSRADEFRAATNHQKRAAGLDDAIGIMQNINAPWELPEAAEPLGDPDCQGKADCLDCDGCRV